MHKRYLYLRPHETLNQHVEPMESIWPQVVIEYDNDKAVSIQVPLDIKVIQSGFWTSHNGGGCPESLEEASSVEVRYHDRTEETILNPGTWDWTYREGEKTILAYRECKEGEA